MPASPNESESDREPRGAQSPVARNINVQQRMRTQNGDHNVLNYRQSQAMVSSDMISKNQNLVDDMNNLQHPSSAIGLKGD